MECWICLSADPPVVDNQVDKAFTRFTVDTVLEADVHQVLRQPTEFIDNYIPSSSTAPEGDDNGWLNCCSCSIGRVHYRCLLEWVRQRVSAACDADICCPSCSRPYRIQYSRGSSQMWRYVAELMADFALSFLHGWGMILKVPLVFCMALVYGVAAVVLMVGPDRAFQLLSRHNPLTEMAEALRFIALPAGFLFLSLTGSEFLLPLVLFQYSLFPRDLDLSRDLFRMSCVWLGLMSLWYFYQSSRGASKRVGRTANFCLFQHVFRHLHIPFAHLLPLADIRLVPKSSYTMFLRISPFKTSDSDEGDNPQFLLLEYRGLDVLAALCFGHLVFYSTAFRFYATMHLRACLNLLADYAHIMWRSYTPADVDTNVDSVLESKPLQNDAKALVEVENEPVVVEPLVPIFSASGSAPPSELASTSKQRAVSQPLFNDPLSTNMSADLQEVMAKLQREIDDAELVEEDEIVDNPKLPFEPAPRELSTETALKFQGFLSRDTSTLSLYTDAELAADSITNSKGSLVLPEPPKSPSVAEEELETAPTTPQGERDEAPRFERVNVFLNFDAVFRHSRKLCLEILVSPFVAHSIIYLLKYCFLLPGLVILYFFIHLFLHSPGDYVANLMSDVCNMLSSNLCRGAVNFLVDPVACSFFPRNMTVSNLIDDDPIYWPLKYLRLLSIHSETELSHMMEHQFSLVSSSGSYTYGFNTCVWSRFDTPIWISFPLVIFMYWAIKLQSDKVLNLQNLFKMGGLRIFPVDG